MNALLAFLHRPAVARAVRTFLISALTLFIPGLLGWLNAVTKWAADQGATPFPDASALTYLAVSAVGAGAIAAINLVWNLLEDATGKGLLRNPRG